MWVCETCLESARFKAKASRLTSVSLPFGCISDGRPPDRDSNLRLSDHWASVLTTSPRSDPQDNDNGRLSTV